MLRRRSERDGSRSEPRQADGIGQQGMQHDGGLGWRNHPILGAGAGAVILGLPRGLRLRRVVAQQMGVRGPIVVFVMGIAIMRVGEGRLDECPEEARGQPRMETFPQASSVYPLQRAVVLLRDYDEGVRQTRVTKFHTFAEADRADKERYLELTPERRLEIVAELRAMVYGCADDETAPRLARVYRIVKLPRS